MVLADIIRECMPILFVESLFFIFIDFCALIALLVTIFKK